MGGGVSKQVKQLLPNKTVKEQEDVHTNLCSNLSQDFPTELPFRELSEEPNLEPTTPSKLLKQDSFVVTKERRDSLNQPSPSPKSGTPTSRLTKSDSFVDTKERRRISLTQQSLFRSPGKTTSPLVTTPPSPLIRKSSLDVYKERRRSGGDNMDIQAKKIASINAERKKLRASLPPSGYSGYSPSSGYSTGAPSVRKGSSIKNLFKSVDDEDEDVLPLETRSCKPRSQRQSAPAKMMTGQQIDNQGESPSSNSSVNSTCSSDQIVVISNRTIIDTNDSTTFIVSQQKSNESNSEPKQEESHFKLLKVSSNSSFHQRKGKQGEYESNQSTSSDFMSEGTAETSRLPDFSRSDESMRNSISGSIEMPMVAPLVQ